jgi:DNA-3-methyladenine glycosylase
VESVHAKAPRKARLPLPLQAAPLARSFYARSPLVVARAVLGRILVHDTPQGRIAGRIVEAEAYCGAEDPASHGYRGPTPRNAVMFGPAGHAYVYFTYGMHHCLNLVTGRRGMASAVLVRALEPLEGLDLMARNRGLEDWRKLTRGPGCVARALGLTLSHDGLDLTRGPLWIADRGGVRAGWSIVSGPRIGISVAREHPWRFFVASHPCVSASSRVAESSLSR